MRVKVINGIFSGLAFTILLALGCGPAGPSQTRQSDNASAESGEVLSAKEPPKTMAKSSATAVLGKPVYDLDKGKKLLMHYMPWYIADTPGGRGSWGGHWTGWRNQHDPTAVNEKGLPDIWSHYHPLIGVYDSIEEDVLECQLLQMKLAGINGVIADWYGIKDVADYRPTHEATQKLFAVAGRLGMEFSVCYEDRTVQLMVERGHLSSNDIAAHLIEVMEWMQSHWFGAKHYTKWNGRPLLLNFGPIYIKDSEPWSRALSSVDPRPRFFALHHLWQDVNADGGFYWVHQNHWEGNPDYPELKRRLHGEFNYRSDDPEQAIVSALPGFKDVYDNPHPVLEHNGGRTMRDSLNAAMDGPWPVIQLVTWNDYGEGTMIEPTHEFGYTFLEIIQDHRKAELGVDNLPFTHEDLRLPARLLELRRSGTVNETELDAVAQLIRMGHTDSADKIMYRLKGSL